MFRYYVIIAILCITAIYVTDLQANQDDYYNFCRIAPMAVKVVDTQGNVMYFAGTGKNTWIAGPTGWIMGADERQIMAGMLHQEVIESDEKLMAVVECR